MRPLLTLSRIILLENEVGMFKVTRFCVVPYERRDGRLVRGETQQFNCLVDAEKVRHRMARHRERVDLLEVTGWPVQDLWDRPKRVG